MPSFSPPVWLTVAFVLLTLVVVAANLYLLHKASQDRVHNWLMVGIPVALVWLAGHALIAESGILEGEQIPPPAMLYLVPTMLIGVGVAFSRIGEALAELPLAWLILLQAFRLPLEGILHGLYGSGNLPVQMTWSGYNFDVITGATALALGVVMLTRTVPRWVVWVWNVLGTVLLFIVVGIAITSLEGPLRQFTEGPTVQLVFHAPWSWIAGVHVWTALVGHLVIYRALIRRPDVNKDPSTG